MTENIPPSPLRTRKFKVKAKITPSLLQTDFHEQNECCLDESNNFEAEEDIDEADVCKAVPEKAPPIEDSCEKRPSSDSDNRHKSTLSQRTRGKKHLFHRTPDKDNDDKRFSLEDLLLGGIILLLLNEGADDGMILIFGYLLFSSF